MVGKAKSDNYKLLKSFPEIILIQELFSYIMPFRPSKDEGTRD